MLEYAYNRESAVSYAHRWAFSRNPEFYNYDNIGGDCTNFASQCLFAGSGVMNPKSWYYKDANNKSPSWTGVSFLWDFITGNSAGLGPYGIQTDSAGMLPGDIVQLSFDGRVFSHTQVVVDTGPEGILIAAHTYDSDFRPLNTYVYEQARFLSIVLVRK